MIHLPPNPGWNALHPLIVHFPIALLLLAPLFVLLGLVFRPPRCKSFLISALIIMVTGTAGVFVALATGEAAGRLAGQEPQIRQVLEQHESLAETTSVLFSVLTVVFAALLLLPRVLRRELNHTLSTALFAAFLILYGTGALFLTNTAHQGGRLVHELGVKAQTQPSDQPTAPAAASTDRAD